MKQKQPKDKQRSFEMNGGYFIDGVAYMDCKITGEPVKNVSTTATSVIGSRAFMARMDKMFPVETKPQRVRTGRPSGWHFMNEFVDKDGTVYHKGKEMPELKGTRPITVIKLRRKPRGEHKSKSYWTEEKRKSFEKEFKNKGLFESQNRRQNG